jgi:hypothetical protein
VACAAGQEEAMVKLDEGAEPVMRRIEQLQIKELEAAARRRMDEAKRQRGEGPERTP